jgi:hypothetical protein
MRRIPTFPSQATISRHLKVSLAFTHFEGTHSGANMANVLIRTVDRYGLRNKVGWLTADNAANNGVAIREFGMQLHDPLFDAKQRYIR